MPIRVPLDLPNVDDDLVYSLARLESVICQLKFSPILRIVESPPAEYQEKIRHVFPEFTEVGGVDIRFEIGGIRVGEAPVQAPRPLKAWQFATRDSAWELAVEAGSVSLKTPKYTHFAEFREKLSLAVAELRDMYRIPVFRRVGLRYVNRFEPRGPQDWSELINPLLIGPIEAFGNSVKVFQNILVVSLDDANVNIRHGINPDSSYVLDLDIFTESEMNAEEYLSVIDRFHNIVLSLFRWCITERMHHELGPSK